MSLVGSSAARTRRCAELRCALWVVALLLAPLPAWSIDIIFEPLSATTHPQILDGTFTFDAENPAFDADGSGLQSILEHTEDVYQDAFEDAQTIRITWWWDADMTFCCGQSIPAMMFENPAGNLTHAIVRFNPTTNYYIDPTPENDSEYDMAQVLYSFGPNTLTATQRAARFTGSVPSVFEAGYNGAVDPLGGAAGQGNDLLTLAFQEVGHSLGMNAGFSGVTNGSGTGEVDDGDYDVNPAIVGGNVMAMLPRGGTQDPLDHLNGNDAVMASLSIGSERTRPSTADYLAIARTQGWTQLDLPRKDFLVGADWHTDSNWLGGMRPLSLDAAYVRHGGDVTLSGIGNVRSLEIDNNSSVDTSTLQLVADFVTLRNSTGSGTPRLIVNDFGELTSETIDIGDQTRLDVLGGLVEANRLNVLAGGELRGHGTVDVTGIFGELINDGLIRATSGMQLVVMSDNNLALDLDGDDENGEVEAIDGDIHFQTGMFDTFNSAMTVGAGREIIFDDGFAVGAGGLLFLDGTANNAATVSGGISAVFDSGVLRADGIGVVENLLLLDDGGILETEDAAAELRLNGSTFFRGGTILGTGTARQNGDAFVEQDTLVNIATYDMDGQAGNTVITIEAGVTFSVDSPAIDTIAGNLFNGTISVEGGTLDMAADWHLGGTLEMIETGGSIPVLAAGGQLTIDSGGQLNVSGSATINTQVVVAGGVFVGSEADFNGETSFTSTAMVETDSPGDAIDLNGLTTMAGGSYVGNGMIKFDGTVFVNSDTSIGMADTDLDGDLGDTEINILPDVTFSIASINLEATANDGFDGVMNVEGTFSSIVPFRLDGQLNMDESGGAALPTIAGTFGWTIFTSGQLNTDGDALIKRETTVQGAMNIGAGITQINAAASFESTAVVQVADGGQLVLNGMTALAGGTYTGDGLIQFNADTSVNSDTTVGTERVDLDGSAETTHIMVNNAALVMNVARIDLSNNSFGGTIDVTGNAARLEVNLGNPLFAWTLSGTSTLNLTADALPPPTLLAGNDLVANGDINADGRLRLAANIGLHGRLDTLDSATDVYFGSGGRNLIYNTAAVSGLGQITNENGTIVNLENGTNIGVDVENSGRLELGFVGGEVSLDLMEPAMALIRGNFSQTGSGTFAVELAGYTQGSEFDWLDVTETARLRGTIEVSLIDGFVPLVGDEFQVLTAMNVVNTFDQEVTFDAEGAYNFDITVLYSATDVVVRIDALHLIGDMDCDGDIDFDDIDDFALGLNDPDAYKVLNGLPASVKGSTDGDGDLDFDDISGFVELLGVGGVQAVPEPSALWLAVCGLLAAAVAARRTRIGR